MKIYPLDTKAGRLKNLTPVIKEQRGYNWMAKEAEIRRKLKEKDEREEGR